MPLVVLLLWLSAGAALAAITVAQRAAERARAQTAADSSALAEAAEPGAGRALAAANGAEVLAEGRAGDTVVVTVARANEAAEAAAALPDPALRGLDPRLVAALAAAEELLGRPIPVVSGFRTYEEQLWLWEHRDENPYPVAYPGTSDHERGLAVDVALEVVGALRTVGAAVGLCQPLPATDPVHFRLCVERSTP